MSVQLIVFPQYFDGTGPLSSLSTQLVVDGIDFNYVNTSSSTLNITTALPQSFVNTYTLLGFKHNNCLTTILCKYLYFIRVFYFCCKHLVSF